MNHSIRILGIDTSLRSTGIGLVEARGNRLSAIEYGNLKIPAQCALSECLKQVNEGVAKIIKRRQPEAVAVEGVFFCRNAKTALALGEARGVAIAACASYCVPVYEYAPRRVKQAVVGFGSASKEQVRKMVMTLLGLREEPQEDASDALAIAICHLHNRTGHQVLMPKEI